MDQETINQLLEAYLGHIAVILLTSLFWSTLKELTENCVKGALLHINPNFNKHDKVEIDDQPATIAHIGITSTEFDLAPDDGQGKRVRVVANSMISKIKLVRVLDQ